MTNGMYPELITRPDIKIFLPPIGGLTIYIWGDPDTIPDEDIELTCRVHDECNGSDVSLIIQCFHKNSKCTRFTNNSISIRVIQTGLWFRHLHLSSLPHSCYRRVYQNSSKRWMWNRNLFPQRG